MCVRTYERTMFFLSCLVLAAIDTAKTAPSAKATDNPVDFNKNSTEQKSNTDIEKSLEQFLDNYYDEYVKKRAEEGIKHGKAKVKSEPEGDLYETMQGDQPLTGNNINENFSQLLPNSSTKYLNSGYSTNNTYLEAVRNRSKENFIQFLKKNILDHLGRSNMTMSKQDDPRLSSLNISQIIPNFLNSTNVLNDDQITEKIRSFYPSCEIPINTDQDLWKDDDIMNLFFNFENMNNDRNGNIATATLRLYRLPENGTTLNLKIDDCDNFNSTEDEKLLRVSIYWYTKSLKKRRVKRRLSDSKMIPIHARWVELSVKPATKAWTRGRNLGLGVHVEDQEGNTLRADRYFKGASCMVGMSTPKPIPTIIIDAARKSNELNRIDSLLGGNSTSTLYSDVHLLPTIDICTLEFPENYTQPAHIMNLRINACNLRKMHEQTQRLAEKDQIERLATLPEYLLPSSRHIRHQRQYLANKKNENDGAGREFDPRSRIVGSTVLITNEEWQNYTNKLNFSTVNR